MTDRRRTFAVARPVAAGAVRRIRRHSTIKARIGEDVMRVRRVATTVHHRALLRQAVLLRQLVVVAVQVIDARRNDDALRIHPRTLADAITRVDGLVRSFCLLTEIRVPGLATDTRSFCQPLAVAIGTGESAELRAVTVAGAGDEETHGLRRWIRR